MIVPDSIEPVEVWRTWYWGTGTGFLHSHNGVPWKPGEPLEGSCINKFVQHLNEEKHEIPAESCHCGIYGCNRLRDCPRGDISGKIKLWGKIIPGSEGARGQFAYPSLLRIQDPSLVDKLACYGVPVELELSLKTRVEAGIIQTYDFVEVYETWISNSCKHYGHYYPSQLVRQYGDQNEASLGHYEVVDEWNQILDEYREKPGLLAKIIPYRYCQYCIENGCDIFPERSNILRCVLCGACIPKVGAGLHNFNGKDICGDCCHKIKAFPIG